MKKRLFTTALTLLLTFSLVMPAVFFAAPQRVYGAEKNSCIGGLLGGIGGAILASIMGEVPSFDMTTSVGTGFTAGATMETCINDLITVPFMRQAVRNMLKSITDSTINWINGTGNPTGQPSYVPNLSVHLQGVGDSAALALINQMKIGFNSPFGSAISSSLLKDYAQKTSVAGFFSANQNTLSKYSKNPAAFVGGSWSQGGLGEWFALTGPTQNNPFILYQAAQRQAVSNVTQAQTNRRQDLVSSGGFLSFCPAGSKSSNSISPSVSCTSPDGRPVNATTPGSAIMSYAQANINSGIGQFVSAQDLDSALGQIVSALGNRVLGATGLFSSSQPSSSRNTTVVSALPSNSSVSSVSIAQTTLSNIAAYTSAWETIATAANTASTSADSLVKFCIVAANKAALATGVNEWGIQVFPQTSPVGVHSVFIDAARKQAVDAQTAITTEILPVLTQAKVETSSFESTKTLALKVQAAAAVVPIADPIQFSTDVATLVSMPPSVLDVNTAQQNARALGGAMANPAGSLTVSGGSLVDQMNLINTNAQLLQTTVCNPASSLYVAPDISGG